MKRRILRLPSDPARCVSRLLLCLLAATAVACAKAPIEARDLARSNIAAAEEAGARDYASSSLTAAEEAFEKGGSAMTRRDYKKAAEWFAIATEKAGEASGEIESGREAARKDAVDLFEEVRENLERSTGLLDQLEGCSTPGSDPQQTPEILAARVDGMRSDVAAGEKEIEDGVYKAALVRASDAGRESAELLAELEKAVAEGTCP
jgi:Domain of unknown function (DUF4398)